MLWCSALLFILAAMPYFRGPIFSVFSPFWFFSSWLQGELPWLFGLFNVGVLLAYSTLAFSGDTQDWFVVVILAITILLCYILHGKTFSTQPAYQQALQTALGVDYENKLPDDLCIKSPAVIAQRDWLKPFSFKRTGVECLADIAYGPAPRQRMDIYRPLRAVAEHASPLLRPVLLHVHGGAWMIGNKKQQAQPLLQYLAQNGWICVDINYHLAPAHRLPAALIDVKMAIAWLKENVSAYGGDATFIALTGESAGAHLSALAALTANVPQFQPGFEYKDTRVQAAVPVYGIYDFTRHEHKRSVMRKLLTTCVMPEAFPGADVWQQLSPLHQVNKAAPPMMIVHGTVDCVVPVVQARDLVGALRHCSNAPVVYAEVDGAQHAFEIFHGVRTQFHIAAVGKFLHFCYAQALAER